ncbi:hypothetical protein NQ317_008822 [Molorchus minor]|uniref:Uncharacterized protein n=1 Tax=Molorchus minor TaxID=1323400 RepID=A0ABQ9JW44_9CUCU|nr:hypothetical protein NQ317_008822 [Molorchus minor]
METRPYSAQYDNALYKRYALSNGEIKDLHVQLEEDERESFVLSTSSSQAGEVDPDSYIGDEIRETWASNTDFLLSIIGQFNRQGPISLWRICPLFKVAAAMFAAETAVRKSNWLGTPDLRYNTKMTAFLTHCVLVLSCDISKTTIAICVSRAQSDDLPLNEERVGFCAVLVAFYVSFYYNVILAWAIYFLGSSISSELPWMHCNNTWNTDKCWESMGPNETTQLLVQRVLNESTRTSRHTPASEFFNRAVLEVQWSNGLHEMGYPKWQLVLCLMIIYSLLYISLFKGVKSSGKVVWVTATMPYVVLTILLIRGLMLPGALSGISYYLQPELSKLKETPGKWVWVDAAVQVFYSVGAGFGVHLSYASYNKFHNNCYRDCIITTIVNCFTSFFSGFVIFTYLGYMSHKQGVHINAVATEGPGLVFQVYPEAVATLPGSHLWSILFFFMLIMLGIDSAPILNNT